MKVLLYTYLFFIVFACKQDEQIFDVNSDDTFISLENNLYSIRVKNDTDSISINVYSSTLSNNNRVLKVNLIEDETTAETENFTYDSSFIIPAGSHIGSFTVTGINTSLNKEIVDDIVFYISSDFKSSPLDPKENMLTVRLSEYAPLLTKGVGGK